MLLSCDEYGCLIHVTGIFVYTQLPIYSLLILHTGFKDSDGSDDGNETEGSQGACLRLNPLELALLGMSGPHDSRFRPLSGPFFVRRVFQRVSLACSLQRGADDCIISQCVA